MYAPPAWRKRLATSAKQATTSAMPAAATTQAQALAGPSRAAMTAGRPKTLLPMTALRTRPVRPTRPIALGRALVTAGTAPDAGGMSFSGMVIPAFVNPDGGSAEAALAALDQAGGFCVRQTGAAELPALLSREVAAGTPRVLVAGGDGTLARAATILAGTAVALAVLPGGTLNHFGRDHDIPLDPAEALALAATGPVGTVDVGYVN